MELRHVLKDLLKRRGLTIQELSGLVGVSPSTIKTWLGGSSPRSWEDVRKVARYFGVSLEYLLFGESDNDKESLEELPLEDVFSGWLRVDIKRAIKIKKTNGD